MSLQIGDCRAILPTLDASSFQCCVTSPPYWGLRDYGTATWEGGDPTCDHVEMACGMSNKNTLGPSGHLPATNAANVGRTRQYRGSCGKCGAVRVDSQLGLEPTPEEYVAHMVEVFREVRRVLRDDGVLWLNLGDSYSGSSASGSAASSTLVGTPNAERRGCGPGKSVPPGLKPKDLVGIPWRTAFALQADGWYLRSDCIWHKPNPMPESVTDRPTKAHEYVFLLSKAERYYYDAKAVAEKMAEASASRYSYAFGGAKSEALVEAEKTGVGNRTRPVGMRDASDLRNCRTVWTIPTQPYTGSHFAVMPAALVSRCILAGSRVGDAVLDPFMGSGTVGHVAEQLGRRWHGCELNPEYGKLIGERTAQVGLGI